MQQGRSVKTRPKHSAWAKHGKHKTVLYDLRRMERDTVKPKKPLMVSSIRELFKGH